MSNNKNKIIMAKLFDLNDEVYYMFFDTETTGLPRNYKAPSSDVNNWPRLVQLSWILTDKNYNVISTNDFIVYPEGFTIPTAASDVHGITTRKAMLEGWPINNVMSRFMADFNKAKIIAGHNIEFDKKIVGAELIRLRNIDALNSKKSICTMTSTTDYCKIPGMYGYKYPKLQELHKMLFGYEFEDAHNSMSDVSATLKCFKELKRRGII